MAGRIWHGGGERRRDDHGIRKTIQNGDHPERTAGGAFAVKGIQQHINGRQAYNWAGRWQQNGRYMAGETAVCSVAEKINGRQNHPGRQKIQNPQKSGCGVESQRHGHMTTTTQRGTRKIRYCNGRRCENVQRNGGMAGAGGRFSRCGGENPGGNEPRGSSRQVAQAVRQSRRRYGRNNQSTRQTQAGRNQCAGRTNGIPQAGRCGESKR